MRFSDSSSVWPVACLIPHVTEGPNCKQRRETYVGCRHFQQQLSQLPECERTSATTAVATGIPAAWPGVADGKFVAPGKHRANHGTNRIVGTATAIACQRQSGGSDRHSSHTDPLQCSARNAEAWHTRAHSPSSGERGRQ